MFLLKLLLRYGKRATAGLKLQVWARVRPLAELRRSPEGSVKRLIMALGGAASVLTQPRQAAAQRALRLPGG